MSLLATIRPLQRALVLLAILALAGCGYTWSDDGTTNFAASPGQPTTGLYRHDVRTVAVPIFVNRTYYRGIEFNLSKAIVSQMEGRTPYKVVPRDRADTVLEGEVLHVGVNTQSRDVFNALPQTQLYFVVVNFTWKDMRTGKILLQRHAFEQTSAYYPVLGEDTFVGSQQCVEQLALAIVESLQAEWGNTRTTTGPAAPEKTPWSYPPMPTTTPADAH
jgi:hypothetical protein